MNASACSRRPGPGSGEPSEQIRRRRKRHLSLGYVTHDPELVPRFRPRHHLGQEPALAAARIADDDGGRDITTGGCVGDLPELLQFGHPAHECAHVPKRTIMAGRRVAFLRGKLLPIRTLRLNAKCGEQSLPKRWTRYGNCGNTRACSESLACSARPRLNPIYAVRRCQRCIRNVKDVSGTKRPLSIRIKQTLMRLRSRQSRASERQ